jgi:pectinesterase
MGYVCFTPEYRLSTEALYPAAVHDLKAAVRWIQANAVHPESGEGDDSKKTSASTYWFGYSKKENHKLLEEASPLTHVGKSAPATLFINSSVERMHAGRNDFIKVLDQYRIYSEVKTFEGAPHHFPFFHPWFEPAVKYVDDFLKKVFTIKSGKNK